MNSSFKEKVFALVVIIALGVVFVPMLFTQNNHASHQVMPVNHHVKAMDVMTSERQKVVTLEADQVWPKPQEMAKPSSLPKSKQPLMTGKEALQATPASTMDLDTAQEARHVKNEVRAVAPKENKVQQTKTTKNEKVAKKIKKEARVKVVQKATIEPPILGDFPLSMVRAEENVPVDKMAATPLEPKPTFEPVESTPSNALVSTKGWAIQMATFSQQNRAHQLKKQLEQDGYPTYTIEKHQGNRTLTQVLVGPYVEKNQAQQFQQTLQKKYSLQSLLVAGDTSSANRA